MQQQTSNMLRNEFIATSAVCGSIIAYGINKEILRVLGRLYRTLCQRMDTITRNGLNNTIFMIPGNLTHFYTEYFLQVFSGMNGIQCNGA